MQSRDASTRLTRDQHLTDLQLKKHEERIKWIVPFHPFSTLACSPHATSTNVNMLLERTPPRKETRGVISPATPSQGVQGTGRYQSSQQPFAWEPLEQLGSSRRDQARHYIRCNDINSEYHASAASSSAPRASPLRPAKLHDIAANQAAKLGRNIMLSKCDADVKVQRNSDYEQVDEKNATLASHRETSAAMQRAEKEQGTCLQKSVNISSDHEAAKVTTKPWDRNQAVPSAVPEDVDASNRDQGASTAASDEFERKLLEAMRQAEAGADPFLDRRKAEMRAESRASLARQRMSQRLSNDPANVSDNEQETCQQQRSNSMRAINEDQLVVDQVTQTRELPRKSCEEECSRSPPSDAASHAPPLKESPREASRPRVKDRLLSDTAPRTYQEVRSVPERQTMANTESNQPTPGDRTGVRETKPPQPSYRSQPTSLGDAKVTLLRAAEEKHPMTQPVPSLQSEPTRAPVVSGPSPKERQLEAEMAALRLSLQRALDDAESLRQCRSSPAPPKGEDAVELRRKYETLKTSYIEAKLAKDEAVLESIAASQKEVALQSEIVGLKAEVLRERLKRQEWEETAQSLAQKVSEYRSARKGAEETAQHQQARLEALESEALEMARKAASVEANRLADTSEKVAERHQKKKLGKPGKDLPSPIRAEVAEEDDFDEMDCVKSVDVRSKAADRPNKKTASSNSQKQPQLTRSGPSRSRVSPVPQDDSEVDRNGAASEEDSDSSFVVRVKDKGKRPRPVEKATAPSTKKAKVSETTKETKAKESAPSTKTSSKAPSKTKEQHQEVPATKTKTVAPVASTVQQSRQPLSSARGNDASLSSPTSSPICAPVAVKKKRRLLGGKASSVSYPSDNTGEDAEAENVLNPNLQLPLQLSPIKSTSGGFRDRFGGTGGGGAGKFGLGLGMAKGKRRDGGLFG